MQDQAIDDITLSSRHVHLVMIALMTGVYLAALSSSVLTTAQPNIVGEFGSQQNLAWIFTGYLLTQTIATPIMARSFDERTLLFDAPAFE